VKFNGSVSVVGDAFIYNGAIMNLSGNTTFQGTIHKDELSQVVHNSADASVQLMTSSELALRDQVLQLASAAEALSATQPADSANPQALDLAASAIYIADPTKSVNVISARHLGLSSGQSITLIGDASSIFVLKVSGTVSLGSGLVLQGVLPSHVLFYANSTHSTSQITIGGQSGVSGSFLSLSRPLSFSGQGSFRGSLLSGSTNTPAISVGGNAGGDAAEFEADAFCSQ
jgi:hypothetical protein